MPVYLHDVDCLELMAKVEFPQRPAQKDETIQQAESQVLSSRITWCGDQLDPRRNDDRFTFIGALRKLVKEHLAFIRCDFTTSDIPTSAVFVIYGAGGWNRWMVKFDGTVCFSKHHSTPEKQKLATEQGFDLW